MTTTRNMKDVAKAWAAQGAGNSKQNNYYAFYSIPDDAQARLRFLPDANPDNSLGFLIEKVSHTLLVNGEKKTIPCLSQYGDACPVCKVSKDYYDAGDKDSGKKYYKSRQYLGQVLVLEDPMVDPKIENSAGKVRLVQLGYSLFNIIKATFEAGELDELPCAFEGGTDFIIKKTKKGEYADYTLSKFSRKSSDLDEDTQAMVTPLLVDLATLLPKKPDLKFVNSLLEAALTGKIHAPSEDNEDDDIDSFKAMVSKKRTASESDDESFEQSKPKATAPKASSTDEDDEEAEAAALLAQLRANREAAKNAASN